MKSRRGVFHSSVASVVLLRFALCWLGYSEHATADAKNGPTVQVVDDCEGVSTSWRIQPSDSLVSVPDQRRTDRAPRHGQRCEFAAVVGRRGGNTIYATHEIPTCAVIDEFAARLWVRGDRTGYQLMVRVRLPRTLDEDGEPVSMLLPGEKYATTGRWQQLSVQDLTPKLASMTRVLRARKDHHVDPAEAYVDMVVLDVYGGAGVNRIWFDDLTIEAAIRRPTSISQNDVLLASAAAALPSPTIDVVNGRLEVDGRPFVPRGVSYRGESMETLKQIGFNTIWLDVPATHQQLEQARRHDLWVICPPPHVTQPFTPHGRVLCWSIDRRKPDARHPVQHVILHIRGRDQSRRPIAVATRNSDGTTPGADIIIETDSKGPASNQTPAWKILGEPLGDWSRWLPLRTQAHEGLAHGCHGFLLQTAAGLDGGSVHARRLAEMLNLELTMLRPWTTASLRHRLSASHVVSVLSDEHSTLALVRRNTAARRGSAKPIEMADYSRRDVYFVEPGGLSPVKLHHVPGGIRILLRPERRTATLLITDRSDVIEQLNRHLRDIGPRMNELMVQAARKELLDLDRRIEQQSTDAGFKSQLRRQLHDLQSHVAPVLETTDRATTFRDLEQMFWNLEAVQSRL